MAENSAISWTDHTFNPWIGCMKVGPGCDHCYAEAWDARGLQKGPSRWGAGAPRTRTSAANWQKPRQWNREAQRTGLRPWVFCASLADVFDNEVDPEWRFDLWGLIGETQHLRWILVTKRIGNAARMLPADWTLGAFGHVGLMSTVVNQAEADRDVPKLLATPAAWRGLSMEPLLGPVRLTEIEISACGRLADGDFTYPKRVDTLTGWAGHYASPTIFHPRSHRIARLDWVIVGGESGPDARPMHPAWARSLRDQCAAAGVPFHFKQWGAWKDGSDFAPDAMAVALDGRVIEPTREALREADRVEPLRGQTMMRCVGKKAAGRLLDGIEHNGMPEVRHG